MLLKNLITMLLLLLYIVTTNVCGIDEIASIDSGIMYMEKLPIKFDADYIIITSEAFYNSSELRKLAEWRSCYNGFSVIIAKFENLCSLYPQKNSDASIKTFIQYVYDNFNSPKSYNGHVKYVLLVGDVEYIPTHISDQESVGESIATDNWYACMDSDDLIPDILIGRLPAKNIGELGIMINKTIQYEQNPLQDDWCNNILMVSGNVSISEKSLEVAKESFLIPSGFNVTEISGIDITSPNNVISELNKGQYILEYAGHGSIDGWGEFDAQDIQKLRNDRMLPAIFSFACNTGQYDSPEKDSLAESFVKAQSGAIAFFGASRQVVADNIAVDLSEAIAQLHIYNIGEIILHAKRKCTPNSANLELYNLMGDPALDLGSPRRILGIPDVFIASSSISFDPEIPKHGEQVLIKANIYNIGSGDAYGVRLEVRDGGIDGAIIDSKYLAKIRAGEKVEYDTIWQTPLGVPQHNIYFKVNPMDTQVENYVDNNNLQKQLLVSLEAEGWPRTLGDKKLSAPVAADVDKDGNIDVLLQTHTFGEYNRLYILRNDGQSLSGWPKTVYCPDYDYETKYSNIASVGPVPSVGDLDGDGALEIVGVFFSNEIYAWKNDGTPMPGCPVKTEGYTTTSPVLADLDSDGKMEIIIGTTSGRIYILSYDGRCFTNWDISTNIKGHLFVMVADLEMDNKPEIIALSSPLPKDANQNGFSMLYAWHCDGSIVNGWHAQMNGTDSILAPVAGDLDGDGKTEIVAISSINLNCKVYIWNFDGSLRAISSFRPNSEVKSSIALGDVDNDGNVDIIAATSNGVLYAWNYDGNQLSGWPVVLPDAYWVSAPILSDIDGDNEIEIVIASYGGKIYAYKGNGIPVNGWPSLLEDKTMLSTPMIVDLNRDTRVELVYTSGFGIIHSLSLTGGSGKHKEKEWPMLLHDSSHTNYYDSDIILLQVSNGNITDNSNMSPNELVKTLLGNVSKTIPKKRNSLLQNYPNPFNPETWIPFYLANEADVYIRIFNTNGQLIRTLSLGRMGSGSYTDRHKAIHWDGRNEAGEEIISGVYFYTITADNFSATRKMIVKK